MIIYLIRTQSIILKDKGAHEKSKLYIASFMNIHLYLE